MDIDHDKSNYQQNSSVGYCHPLVLLEAEEVPTTTTSGKMPQSLRQAAWIARRTVMVGCNRAIIVSSIIATILWWLDLHAKFVKVSVIIGCQVITLCSHQDNMVKICVYALTEPWPAWLSRKCSAPEMWQSRICLTMKSGNRQAQLAHDISWSRPSKSAMTQVVLLPDFFTNSWSIISGAVFWLQNLRYHRNPGGIQTEWYDPLSIDQGFADSEAQGPRWDSTTFIKIASFCRNDDKKSHYHIGTETGANSKSVHNNGSMAQMFCFVMFVFHMYPYVANTWHSSIFSAAPALGLPCEMRLQRILWRQHSPSPGLGKMGEQLQHLLCTEHSLWVREQNAGRYKACCFFNVSRLT